jgi:outer membrane protein assembly factor BamA
LDDILKNNGYFDFSKQYITFDVDSSLGNHRISIGTRITNPDDGSSHKVFRVDSVVFTTDANLQISNLRMKRDADVYNNITYRNYIKSYSYKVLDRRLFIYPGQIYSKKNTFDTQTQLGFMDIFKFVNINYDTTGGRFIANIFTNPLDKYQFALESGLNVSVGLPGPFINTSMKVRNVFKGLEILQFNVRWGLEGVASATNVTDVYSSQEFSTTLSLTFPQFVAPLGRNSKLRTNPLNPRTTIQGGFTFLDRPEYTRNNVNTSFSYLWQNRNNAYYNLTIAEVSLINTLDVDPDFRDLLDDLRNQGNNLWRSFEPSFVSSMLFSATFNYNKYGYYQNKASYLRLSTDIGGTFLSLYGTDFFENRDLETYQFVKFNVDFRHHTPLPYSTQIAYKVNVGIANPYGENATLPYEKFFFIGGSNSIRAWRPRRLGPGSYIRTDSTSGLADDSFEQPGEIILETSFEIRKKILGFLESAIFIDAGNIWSLKEDEQRPGSQFKLDSFLEQIAIGSGLGVRLNFDFLIVRLDAGMKFYDPARDKGKRFIFNSGFKDGAFRDVDTVILNLGVGYPF